MSPRAHEKLQRRVQHIRSTLWQLIGPPTVWALHFLICYLYAAVLCAKSGPPMELGGLRLVVSTATAAALLLVAATGYIAWAQSRLPGDPPPHDESTDEDRHRFLASAKLLLAALSFIAIVYTAIPAYIFENCR